MERLASVFIGSRPRRIRLVRASLISDIAITFSSLFEHAGCQLIVTRETFTRKRRFLRAPSACNGRTEGKVVTLTRDLGIPGMGNEIRWIRINRECVGVNVYFLKREEG